MPKSASLAVPRPSIKMFDGFTSRWRRMEGTARPSASCNNRPLTSDQPYRPC